MKANLDYTNLNETANFRDAGSWINYISGRNVIPEGRILRGGTIKWITDPAVVGNPKTIFCLQRGADQSFPGVHNVHFPISTDHEKYRTADPAVRTWLRSIVRTIETGVEYPLYIHCLSGRDRTGVVVAALLKICGADDADVIEEYWLSSGTENLPGIHTALEGFRDLDSYFKGIDLSIVRSYLMDTDRPA